MADFNGSYETDGLEQLTEAHLEALELLDVVHQICIQKKITYTLANQVLIGLNSGKSFAKLAPNITLVVKYEYFKQLREELRSFAEHNTTYIFVDAKNTQQFDTLAMYFAKRNKVLLPEGRKQDEVYYYTHVTIVPVFYAGNTWWEFNAKTKLYKKAFKALNARAPLPQRTFFTRIRIIRRIIRDAWYRRKRDEVELSKLERMFGSEPQSKLCFFSVTDRAARVIKIACDVMDNVEEIELSGHSCYVSKYASDIVKCYSKDYQEKVLKYRVSDLVRKGGENLRRVQLIQTEMLVEFDRVCRKNNIRYNIAFGTLLGAARHKGFIPWDDDVDVIVPIEDYLKLDEAMKKDLDTTRFFWRTIDTEVDFNLTFKHMKRNGTVYMKPGRDNFNFHRGVLIDVFPVFHSANNRVAHWIQTRLCFFYRTATWAYMGADSERKKAKRLIYNWMKKPGPRKNLESFMKCATMFPKKNAFYSYYNATFRSPYHTSYLSEEVFDSPIEIEFEGHSFLAPSNYEEALSYCFGADYRLYPTNRRPNHFAILDLGNLYEDDLRVIKSK